MSKQLFIIGGNGYVGSVIVEFAIKDGFTVHAISRSQSSDEKLKSLGALPIRGDLTSLDLITSESKQATVVINLATSYEFGSDYESSGQLAKDNAAADAIAKALAGTTKPFLMTSGTLGVLADPNGGETDETAPHEPNPINARHKHSKYCVDLAASQGIRAICIRLAAYVYGRGGSGIKLFSEMAAKSGAFTIINGGKNRNTTVHVDDLARLYLIAAEKAEAGETFIASNATNLTAKDIYGLLAAEIDIPLKDLTLEEASKAMPPFFVKFLSAENRASSKKARETLGWEPTEVGLLEDIKTGSYQPLIKSLRK
jgi:nucleoside-diphosphate-sugar epimerase